MSDIIFLSNVRVSVPNLVEPQRNQTPDGKVKLSYNAEFIVPADHPAFGQFQQAVAKLAQAKWGEHANQVLQLIDQDKRLRCFGNGNEKVNKKTFQPYDGYAGNMYISAGRNTPPQMIQADGKPIDPNDSMAYQQLARKIYGGCRVNAAVKPWLQDNTYGRAVRCDLVAIQFAGDDKAFGEGAVDVSGMFGAVQAGSAPASTTMPNLPPFMMGA